MFNVIGDIYTCI